MRKRFIFVLLALTLMTAVLNYCLHFSVNANILPPTSLDHHPIKIDPNKTFEVEQLWQNCRNNAFIEGSIWISNATGLNYTALFNFPAAKQKPSCEDPLITLTTHGEYPYLDNLVTLVLRWQGPISIASYIPFEQDFNNALIRIAYLRECTTPLIKEWVSFHLFAETKHFPYSFKKATRKWRYFTRNRSASLCSNPPVFNESVATSRKLHNLLLPINVARNIARRTARTHFILASDIELFPSINFIPQFFDLLKRKETFFQNRFNHYVFVLPTFEVKPKNILPETKKQLVRLINTNAAVNFHKYVCLACHKIPRYEAWLNDSGNPNQLGVFSVTKRHVNWEPIFVSLNSIPLYNEELSYEGIRDKMAHSYLMCVLDYDFMILDNAFLVHKVGVKRRKVAKSQRIISSEFITKQQATVDNIYVKILKNYGREHQMKCGNVTGRTYTRRRIQTQQFI